MTDPDNHRLFFCINSGRAGSEYLARLLGTAPGVLSFHEAEPRMIGPYLDMINRAPYTSSFEERRIKSFAIREILRQAPPETIYSETNHMFIKTFFDVVVEDFDNVEVIVLRRELARVLKSFMELRYFTPANQAWPRWLSAPNAATAAIPCIDDPTRLDPYDLAIAYLIDIEARAMRFQASVPGIRIHDIRAEALSDYDKVERFFHELRITTGPATEELTGRAINRRVEMKQKFSNPVDLDYCLTRLERYLEIAKSKGVPVPDTLAIAPYTS